VNITQPHPGFYNLLVLRGDSVHLSTQLVCIVGFKKDIDCKVYVFLPFFVIFCGLVLSPGDYR
jgi:hypothetical protein